MNPFASTIEEEHLFNIANGKAALDETGNFLTSVWTIGFSARNCFIKDCNNNRNACQNTIKQQKIKNFAPEAGIYKVLSKNKSLIRYQWPAIFLEASCTMPCKQKLTWSKYLDVHWHRCHWQWALCVEQCRKHQSWNCFKSLKKELHQIHLQMLTWP